MLKTEINVFKVKNNFYSEITKNTQNKEKAGQGIMLRTLVSAIKPTDCRRSVCHWHSVGPDEWQEGGVPKAILTSHQHTSCPTCSLAVMIMRDTGSLHVCETFRCSFA